MTMYAVIASDYTGGGAGALDKEDGALFSAGDFAMVAKAGKAPEWYEFISTTDAENSPYLIRPDTNGTGVAWRQCDLITGNCTLYVTTAGNDSTGNGTSSAPWATLGKTITWITDKRASYDTTITISVGAGTFVEAGLITIMGHIFGNVSIAGAGSASTTLSWATAGTGGILIDRNTALQNIKTIKLLGNGTSGNGIELAYNSSLYVFSDLVVDSFGAGVIVGQSCALHAGNALTSQNNNTNGLVANFGAHARINGCTFDSNGDRGIYGISSSNIYASGSTSTNNVYGYYAHRNSFIEASGCTVSGNTTDYSPAKTTANDPTFGNQGSWIYG